LLERYRDFSCTFNDDIQGTAAVGVAGILATLSASNMKLTDHKFLFFGAGGAACGIAHLIVRALMKSGLSKAQAAKRIYMFDKDGLVTMNRFDSAEMPPERKLFAHDIQNIDNLEETVRTVKPTALLGVAGVGQAFNETVCRQMCENTARPVIFALSNPTTHAECTPEQAYTWTDGKCIFASGSPFDPVTLPSGKVMSPGQGNNVYIFPGIALGVIATGAQRITEEMFLVAAEALAEQVTEQDLEVGRVYPPMANIQDVSFQIALRVAQIAYMQGLATVIPEPEDKHNLIRSVLYSPDYKSYLPQTYDYPMGHEEEFEDDME